MLSPLKILIIIVILLLIFGAGRLGELGKGLGEGIRNFKKGIADEDEPEEEAAEPPKVPKQLPPKREIAEAEMDQTEPSRSGTPKES